MHDDKTTINIQKGLIAALEKLVMNYIGKTYHISGLLSSSTSFTLHIEGAFGKKELVALCKRLALDAEMLGEGQINISKTANEILEEIRQISKPDQVNG